MRKTSTAAIVHTEFEGLDIIPSDKNLVAANLELIELQNRESRLREKLGDRSRPLSLHPDRLPTGPRST